MADSNAPIDGPFSLPEFQRRLVAGRIDRNTVVRMPNGEKWMLLPSILDSAPRARGLTTRRDRLRSVSAYRSVRRLLGIAAWLFYILAMNAVLSEQPWIGIFWEAAENTQSPVIARIGLALLLGLCGSILQFGGAMVVDLFDLLLGVGVFRLDRTSEEPRQAGVDEGLPSRENDGPFPRQNG